jgi:hypothetical protein
MEPPDIARSTKITTTAAAATEGIIEPTEVVRVMQKGMQGVLCVCAFYSFGIQSTGPPSISPLSLGWVFWLDPTKFCLFVCLTHTHTHTLFVLAHTTIYL